jgi:uncharacterized protein
MHIPPVKHSIEQYVAENIWVSFIEDTYFDRSWDVVGEDNIMWGSDYPHPRNTFPNSREIMNKRMAGSPPRVMAKAAGLNCARLFNMEVPAEARAVAAE